MFKIYWISGWASQWHGQFCPLRTLYIVHHRALGSFATVYLPDDIDHSELINKLASIDGIMLAIDREVACARFDLPAVRIGDVVLISDEDMTIGTSADRHDLAALKEPLRSHGGLTEQTVPFIINRKIDLPSSP